MTGVINHTNTTPIQYPCKNSNSPKISVFGMKIKIELVLILVWSSETIRILNRDQSWPIVETIKIFRFKSINPSSLYTKLDFHRFPFISQTYHTTVFHPKYYFTPSFALTLSDFTPSQGEIGWSKGHSKIGKFCNWWGEVKKDAK